MSSADRLNFRASRAHPPCGVPRIGRHAAVLRGTFRARRRLAVAKRDGGRALRARRQHRHDGAARLAISRRQARPARFVVSRDRAQAAAARCGADRGREGASRRIHAAVRRFDARSFINIRHACSKVSYDHRRTAPRATRHRGAVSRARSRISRAAARWSTAGGDRRKPPASGFSRERLARRARSGPRAQSLRPRIAGGTDAWRLWRRARSDGRSRLRPRRECRIDESRCVNAREASTALIECSAVRQRRPSGPAISRITRSMPWVMRASLSTSTLSGVSVVL